MFTGFPSIQVGINFRHTCDFSLAIIRYVLELSFFFLISKMKYLNLGVTKVKLLITKK